MESEAKIGAGGATKPRNFWRIGDSVVLLAYSTVILWILPYHEKWADEAQAWLIARDLDLQTIWFHELRYEGSPGLWHTILWIAQHVFHARYGALGYIGAFFAIAGAAVLIFLAPFPRYIRWPLAFTYVMVYQYAVIARPYTLLPLLVFAAAYLFHDSAHPGSITLVLALLALLTLHGTILAICFGSAYLLDKRRQWASFNRRLRWKYFGYAVALAVAIVFVCLILKPTSDIEEFATKQKAAELAQMLNVKLPTPQMKLISIVSGAFLGYLIPSIVFLLAAGIWCALRGKFAPFSISAIALILLYVAIHGYSHHHGTLTIAVLSALWIAWPSAEERSNFNLFETRLLQTMASLLLIFCAIQIWDSGVVLKHEYLLPYSGAQDAAKYLIDNGALQKPICGYLYGVAGIQAYFDRNIFANLTRSYFHHGLPLEGEELDINEVARISPDYIVIFSEQPQLMLDSGVLNPLIPMGYRMVHFSDGYLLYRRGFYVRQAYLIFGRGNWKEGIPAN